MQRTIKIPQFRCRIIIMLVPDVKEAINKLSGPKGFAKVTKDAYAYVASFDIDRYYILYDKANIFHGVIAHEVYHAIEWLSRDYGVVDEETKAHLIDLVTDEVYTMLESKKIKLIDRPAT